MEDYRREKRFVEEEKPYWFDLRGGTRFSGELRFEPELYFPDAHYRKAVQELEREEPVFDGGQLHKGKRRVKLYYWMNPDTDAALSHTEVNGEETIPFFDNIQTAETYLENRSETVDDHRYEKLSLYQATVQKVEDAKDVLTEQAGFDQFITDGGHDTVYFWYDPDTNAVIQERVEPGIWASLFDQEEEATCFMKQYQEEDSVDTSHFQLYEAELRYLRTGDELTK